MRRRKRPQQWPLPEWTEAQILAWADAHHALAGVWPRRESGTVRGVWGVRWSAVNAALQKGHRGLPGGSSLARLLAARRGVRNRKGLDPLTVPKILRWADAYKRRTGNWPHHYTEPRAIPGSHGETWLGVDSALRAGTRGLPGGSSLARVLAEHRGVRNPQDLPPLTVPQILAWTDAFHDRTGRWPKQKDWRESIPDSGGETWGNVLQAVALGLRRMPGTYTLFDLLAEHWGVRNVGNLPPLTERQILGWAEAFFAAHGRWPTVNGAEQVVPGSGGERWVNLDQALRKGLRGLSGGSSLAKLRTRHRGRSSTRSGSGRAAFSRDV